MTRRHQRIIQWSVLHRYVSVLNVKHTSLVFTTVRPRHVWSYACFAGDVGRALFRNHVVTFQYWSHRVVCLIL